MCPTVPVTRVPALIHQRERWARGYLQTLMQFGWTRTTAIPWLKQLGFAFSLSVRMLFLTMLGLLIAQWRPSRELVDASHRIDLFSGRRLDGARNRKVGDARR